MGAPNTFVGRPIQRVEDYRMLRGRGTYVADVNRPGQLHAVILRSSVAHGTIRRIDVRRALSLAGVKCVLTAADFGQPIPYIPVRMHALPQLRSFCQPIIANQKVRYVGEPLGVIVAENAYVAEDALEHIDVEIDELPAVTNATKVSSAAPVHDCQASNEAITWKATFGDAQAAFSGADYVRRASFGVQRHAPMFLEPRGFVAEWNPAGTALTVWGAAKMAWWNRGVLAKAFKLDPEAIKLIEVDVGGGFGSRGEFYPEDYLIPAVALRVGGPVKWVEDRREHMMSANHAREVQCDVELALTGDGKFLGLRGHVSADIGAYIRANGPVSPRNIAQYMCGPYRFAGVELTCSMMLTNKTPSGSYRAPGRFEADFVRERLIDMAARELGLDRVALRRRNFIGADEMPYPLPTIGPAEGKNELDSGDYGAVFDRCLADFGWAEKERLRGQLIDGCYHGLGVGSFIEGGAVGPKEDVRLVLQRDGNLSVYVGSSAIGQGIETSLAQIAADATELPFHKITVHHGSTDYVKEGYGSYNSRSTVMGGSSIILAATKLKERLRAAAALHFSCDSKEVFLEGEEVRYESKRASLSEILDGSIEVEASFHSAKNTWAYGTQAAHVAVDPGTGQVKVLDYFSVEDVGRMINPLTLHGQAIGGIVQGLGGTLLEQLVYDEQGQLLTGSLAEYFLPTATDFPTVRALTLELKRSPNNPLGAKGAAEGGVIPVGGVIANAVADALAHLDVQPTHLPLSPARVWALIQDAKDPSASISSEQE